MTQQENQRSRYLKWKERHPNGERDNSKKWRLENREKYLEINRRSAEKHKEKVIALQVAYRENKKRKRLIKKFILLIYYRANKTEIDNNLKVIADERIDRKAENRKRYYEKNKEKAYQRSVEFKKKVGNTYYYHRNIHVKLKVRIRNRLRTALKINQKRGSTIDYLGCTVPELKNHIENQFRDGMSWGNWKHDGWHIDHIRPLASFDLTDDNQLREACNYRNLQPLWAHENLTKSSQYDRMTGTCTNGLTIEL